MKLIKALSLFAFMAELSFAQSGSVSTFNLCSSCAIRQFIPGMANIPPQVQVWIFDPPAGNDAYLITLTYQGTDGAAHTLTQYVAGFGGTNTMWPAPVDALSVASVKVQPMKLTGAAFQTSGQ